MAVPAPPHPPPGDRWVGTPSPALGFLLRGASWSSSSCFLCIVLWGRPAPPCLQAAGPLPMASALGPIGVGWDGEYWGWNWEYWGWNWNPELARSCSLGLGPWALPCVAMAGQRPGCRAGRERGPLPATQCEVESCAVPSRTVSGATWPWHPKCGLGTLPPTGSQEPWEATARGGDGMLECRGSCWNHQEGSHGRLSSVPGAMGSKTHGEQLLGPSFRRGLLQAQNSEQGEATPLQTRGVRREASEGLGMWRSWVRVGEGESSPSQSTSPTPCYVLRGQLPHCFWTGPTFVSWWGQGEQRRP